MRSNTGETGMENSLGDNRPVLASSVTSWAEENKLVIIKNGNK
jgi:hypothetical protein